MLPVEGSLAKGSGGVNMDTFGNKEVLGEG